MIKLTKWKCHYTTEWYHTTEMLPFLVVKDGMIFGLWTKYYNNTMSRKRIKNKPIFQNLWNCKVYNGWSTAKWGLNAFWVPSNSINEMGSR